jgi:hypothetical protein
MSKLYNTPFEASLRMLLLLESATKQGFSVDMMTGIDFIAIYGKEFDLPLENLHGDNRYKFSEWTARRDLIHKASKHLALDQLIDVNFTKQGFTYSANDNGLKFSKCLSCDYANEYRKAVSLVYPWLTDKSELEVLKVIRKRSIDSLKED